jgi:hypothetical protein
MPRGQGHGEEFADRLAFNIHTKLLQAAQRFLGQDRQQPDERLVDPLRRQIQDRVETRGLIRLLSQFKRRGGIDVTVRCTRQLDRQCRTLLKLKIPIRAIQLLRKLLA